MLEELRIQNFAIIDHLELDFAVGLNVITGETGAGKSIIIDAIELLLGSKVDPSLIRANAEKALVEGVFALKGTVRRQPLPILEREEILDDAASEYITLSREVRRNGRSTARVNGVAVSAEVMREVGEALVDIHGQTAHMSLFRPREHVDLLDKFANLVAERAALAQIVETLNAIRGQIRVLVQDKEELQRRADRLRYEVDEIEKASLQPNEESDLVAERNRLANSEQLATMANHVVALLNGDGRDSTTPALTALLQVAAAMGKLVKIDPSRSDDYQLAEELSANAKELALTMSQYADHIEYNPQRLDELEERLELLKTLKRRYKSENIAGILAYAAKAAQELNNIEHGEERLEELRGQETKLLHQIGDLCGRIQQTRAKASEALAKRIVRELQDLRMERTQFEVVLTQIEDPDGCYVEGKRYAFDATGMDKVEFMMSANPGEPLRPLAKVASGGEAARIMLSLKRVLASADETPTLIFDEIDQGIGGRIGTVVGEKLWSLTDGHQIMVVTHMPQLAGFADKHYHVKKLVTGDRTATEVSWIESDRQRIIELAAMLGAEGEAGIESARGIFEGARLRKHELRYPKQENLL